MRMARSGGADVQCVAVGVGVHRDRFHAQLVAGTDDPNGDLAAVGNQDAPEGWGPVFAQRRGPVWAGGVPHRGMLPCFLRGFVSRLSASMSRAAMSRGRVSDGRMTSST